MKPQSFLRSVCALVSLASFLLLPVSLHAQRSGQVTRSGSTWTTKIDGSIIHTGTDMFAAVQAGINGLTPNRTSKEIVRILNSGDSGINSSGIKAIHMASYTILDFNGATINVNDTNSLVVPIQADRKVQVEVRNLRVTGRPRYAIWVKSCDGIILNNTTLNLSHPGQVGLGIRVDDSTNGWSRNLTINGTTVITGSRDNAVETAGVDGFSIGNVSATDVGACGVLLNTSRNGTVGTVTGVRCNQGGSYASFRVANSNGPSVSVTKVYSRNSGRGFFSVSGSRGCIVGNVDIASSTNQGVLLENANETRVNSGLIANCGSDGIRLAQTTTYCYLTNLRVGSGNARGFIETSPGNYNRIHDSDLTGNNGANLSKSGAQTTTTGSTW